MEKRYPAYRVKFSAVRGTEHVADTTESYPAKRESCVHMGKTLSLSPRSRLSTSEISVHGKTFRLI
jgi:hypothetical protein